ncbi:MAG: TetR/AcrR family transcriptional regulator [Lachnospiraceae bacterium]
MTFTAKADKTKEKLLLCAKAEFLEKGFRNASVREIARAAGLTTGSIYRYFSDKDTLFSAVTQNAMAELDAEYEAMSHAAFAELEKGIPYGKEQGTENISRLFDVIYRYFDEFYLMIVQSEGSSRENFVANLIELETVSTLEYVAQLKQKYDSQYVLEEAGVRALAAACFTSMLAPVRLRMDKESALRHIAFLGEFFTDGWKGIEEKIKQS